MVAPAEQQRRQRQQQQHRRQQGVPTKIIGMSSAKDLTVDEYQSCIPRNTGCYVVHGELDATYVGFNEAGVKSSVSRAVREEMVDNGFEYDNDFEYEVEYLGAGGAAASDGGARSANTPSSLNMGDVLDALPPSDGRHGITPYGIGILAALGSAFLVICYVIFVKADVPSNVKDRIDERNVRKVSKRKALGEDDNEQRYAQDDYCYDLGSVVAIDRGKDDGEDGFEVHSTLTSSRSRSNSSNGQYSQVSRHSAKTKRMSNKAGDVNHGTAQKSSSLLEDEDDLQDSDAAVRTRSGIAVHPDDAGCIPKDSSSSSDSIERAAPISNHTGMQPAGTPLQVDRTPSPASAAGTHQLPSISEAELPPSMRDTPRIAYSHPNRGGRGNSPLVHVWEV